MIHWEIKSRPKNSKEKWHYHYVIHYHKIGALYQIKQMRKDNPNRKYRLEKRKKVKI